MRHLLHPGRIRRWVALGTALAVIGGIAVRFLATSPLWLDEALTVNIASLPAGDIWGALRHDGHPPLYYWLLHVWSELFGDDDVAVRSFSSVCSVLTLPLVWRLGRTTGGPAVARWSLVLVALSPFAVRYATEARMYAFVMLLVVGGALTLDGVLRRPGLTNVAGLALIGAALLWTHYWSVYLLATVGGLLIVRWRRARGDRDATRWAIVALVAGGVAFLPWVPTLLDQAAHTGTPWADPSRPTVVAQVTIADLGGGGFAEALLLGTLLVVLGVAAFAHLDRITLREPAEPLDVRVLAVVSIGTLLLGSVVSFASGGAFASRYSSVVAPLILVVAAVGVTRMRPIWLQRAAGAAVVVLASVAILYNIGDARTSAGDVAARIDEDGGRRDLVVVCPDQLAPALDRALLDRDLDLEVIPYPTAGDPRFVDWRDYEERNDDADPVEFAEDLLVAAGDDPIWLVWNGTYRTFEDDCEAIVVTLGAARPGVSYDAETGAFESANLIRFP